MKVIDLEGYISKIPNNFYVSKTDFKEKNFEPKKSKVIILHRYYNPTKAEVFDNIYSVALNLHNNLFETEDETIQEILSEMPVVIPGIIEKKGDFYNALMENTPAPNEKYHRVCLEYGTALSKIVKRKKIKINKFKRHMERNTGNTPDLGWMFDVVLTLENGNLPNKSLIDIFVNEEVTSSRKFAIDLHNYIEQREVKTLMDTFYEAFSLYENIESIIDTSDSHLQRASIAAVNNLYNYYLSIGEEEPREEPKPRLDLKNRIGADPDFYKNN
ncbi:MAG: hypothetical protein Q8R00_00470 [Candidatus Nanoarchaeia archaeon]|nr:hypothetical protein [Candidatus Nanoarchaeia archaeon]